MKKLLAALLFAFLPAVADAQPTTPTTLPGCVYNATPPTLADKQVVPWQCDVNGKLITSSSGVVNLTIGSTTITGGANTRILYDNSGVLGEYTITGTGTVVAMQTSPVFVTPTLGVASGTSLTLNPGPLTLTGGTVTSSTPLISGTQMWNSGGTTFIGSLFDITNTASAAASKIFDYRVGGSTRFNLDTGGIVRIPTGATAGYYFGTGEYGVLGRGTISTGVSVVVNGGEIINFYSTGVELGSTGTFGWSSGGLSGSPDTILRRDAANTLALRNGTTAQTFNLYSTFTDASNYERMYLSVTGGGSAFEIATTQAGSGTARRLGIGTVGSAVVRIFTANVDRWEIGTAGHLIASTDNTYDIGASGATRPRILYIGTNITLPNSQVWNSGGTMQVASGGTFGWASRSNVASPSDGVITLYDAAQATFGRLQFGGTTSSFAAISLSTTDLRIVLADNSALTNLSTRTNSVSPVDVASLPACTTVRKGTRSFVTNANSTTFASTVAAGGTNNVPVTCDGTNWIIGYIMDKLYNMFASFLPKWGFA